MDVTHDHLSAVVDRLEGTVRREVDTLRRDLLDRINGLYQRREQEEGRLLLIDRTLGVTTAELRVVKHDLAHHLQSHVLFDALVEKVLGLKVSANRQTPSKAFLTGIIAAVIALAGIAQIALEFVSELVKRLKP